jgi:hypothetical protein
MEMNRKFLEITASFIFFIFIFAAGETLAVTKQVPLTIKAEVKNLSKLELDSTTVTFEVGSLSPDDSPLINSSPSQLSVTAKARTGAKTNVTLTVLATGDLVSGSEIVPINNVNWTASGPGFTGGIMDKISPQPIGSWVGSGIHPGRISFQLANRWEYAKGDYAITTVFTLTAP